MTNLTGMTITIEQIEALRTEAAQHGDDAQVDICDAALSDIRTGARDAGAVKWTKLCADAILAARAMDDGAVRS